MLRFKSKKQKNKTIENKIAKAKTKLNLKEFELGVMRYKQKSSLIASGDLRVMTKKL